jgi:hypothetical protein
MAIRVQPPCCCRNELPLGLLAGRPVRLLTISSEMLKGGLHARRDPFQADPIENYRRLSKPRWSLQLIEAFRQFARPPTTTTTTMVDIKIGHH